MRPLNDVPSSVYRIQANEKFPLKKAISYLDYFYDLGIDGVYLSPIFASTSSHGYDITDPNRLNAAIGPLQDYDEFCAKLKQLEMKQILDVVPNHMGIKSHNLWWKDVLEKGRESPFAHFFDIDWNPDKKELRNKILLPILKDPYGQALEKGEIQFHFDDGFYISYADYQLPINSESHEFIREHEKELRSQTSFKRLHELLEKQHYRLSHWLVAGQEINYRRFFDINELVCIHIEKQEVLNAHHKWIFNLLAKKQIEGLRIDHPDGLYNPTEYYNRIREKGNPLLLVEKVLDFREEMPQSWQIDGTVGYDFLNVLNGVFVEKKNEKAFDRIFTHFIGWTMDYEELLYERKKAYIKFHMGSEVNALGRRLDQISEKNLNYRDFTRVDLTRALQEVIACFPIYRTYINPNEEISKKEEYAIVYAVERAKTKLPEVDRSVFQYLSDLLLFKLEGMNEFEESIYDFILRFQQITAPAMAKGLEDSVYYIYNRLISLNEVGGHPKNFGFTKNEFHEFNTTKLKKWPLGFLATSTHDTKLSYDVRMRLNVISEMPERWKRLVNDWKKSNQKYKTHIKNAFFPDANAEYYLYQMLLGVWPPLGDVSKELQDRIWAAFLKSLREGGIFTNWRLLNEEYEEAAKKFLYAILTPSAENEFLASFLPFQKEIAHLGCLNSLSALVLKAGSCGVFDLYQGDELWNYCLMDPDNRGEVDFELRKTLLKNDSALKNPPISLFDDSIKIDLLSLIFHLRRQYKALFLSGEYVPLTIQGKRRENVIAFMRKRENDFLFFLAGRFFSKISSLEKNPSWEETELSLPKGIKVTELQELITGKLIPIQKKGKRSLVPLQEVFHAFPFGILGVKHE